MSDEQIGEQGAAQDDRRPAEEQPQEQEAYPTYVPPAPADAPLGGGSGAPPVAPGPPIAGQPEAGRQAEEQPTGQPWTQAPRNPNPSLPRGQGSPIVSGPPRSVKEPVPAAAFNITTALMAIGGVVLVLVIILVIVIAIGHH